MAKDFNSAYEDWFRKVQGDMSSSGSPMIKPTETVTADPITREQPFDDVVKPMANKATRIDPSQDEAVKNKAKQLASNGQNPIMAYLSSLTPTYDANKEKRLKNLAIVNSLGTVLNSIVNTIGVSKGAPAANMVDNNPYVAASLKEMHDTRDKLGEGYKMLNLEELIRQQNQADQMANMDYRWKQMEGESEKEYKRRIELMEKEQGYRTSERVASETFQSNKMDDQFTNSINQIKESGNQSRQTIGTQQAKDIAVEEVKQGNRVKLIRARADAVKEDKGVYLINPVTNKPYPRPIYDNEIPSLYAKLKKYAPAEVQALEMELSNTYDKKTIMGTVVAELSGYIIEDIENLFSTPMQMPGQSDQDAQSTGGIY